MQKRMLYYSEAQKASCKCRGWGWGL
jgi:hypothetical protein